MKRFLKELLPIYVIILSYGQSLFGYELFFNNFTEKTLIIASKKRAGIVEKYYQIVGPGKSVIQVWNDANCLESLQWAEVNPKLPLRGGLDLVDANRGGQIPPDKQKTFDETFFNKTSGKGLYLWNYLKIVMVPSAIYQQTVKSAEKLVKGFDQMVCQTTSILLLEQIDKVFGALQQALRQSKVRLQQATNADERNSLNITINQQEAKVQEYLNNLKTATSKVGCLFNLAQIAEAAGTIQGISICKNRQFAIFDTGKKDPLTGMPLFIAETTEGE